MDKKLSAFFERILDPDARKGDGEDFFSPDIGALAAGWADLRKPGPTPVSAEDPAGRLAAFLDGGLDSEAQKGFEAELAATPAELQELMSARFFVDEVEAAFEKPPRQLLEIALTGLQPVSGGGSGGLAALLGGLRAIPGTWRLAGGALATAALAAVVVTGEIGHRATAPFAAVPSQQIGAAPATESEILDAASASQVSAQQQLEAAKAMQSDGALKAASANSPASLASKGPCETSAGREMSSSTEAASSERTAAESRCDEQKLAEPAYGSKYGTGAANAEMPAAAMPAESAPYSMDGSSAPAAMPPRE